MHIVELFEKFSAGKLVMDSDKAKKITQLVVQAQESGPSYWSLSDRRGDLRSDYEQLNGQEVEFKKILKMAEGYDLWESSAENLVDLVTLKKASCVVFFVTKMVQTYL